VAVAASVDLSRVPLAAREEVLGALERARAGKVRFTGHDGKAFDNVPPLLPGGSVYHEWTAAAAGAPRGPYRVILADQNPTAIYFWNHVDPPILIGPLP
jgi:hypothetical protein